MKTLISDAGYCSEKNILACEKAIITPLIAVAREDHHPHWSERHTEPAPLAEGATPVQTMAHRLKTLAGIKVIAEKGRITWQRKSCYNLRSNVELAMQRYKRISGNTMKARTLPQQKTEARFSVSELNMMTNLECQSQ